MGIMKKKIEIREACPYGCYSGACAGKKKQMDCFGLRRYCNVFVIVKLQPDQHHFADNRALTEHNDRSVRMACFDLPADYDRSAYSHRASFGSYGAPEIVFARICDFYRRGDFMRLLRYVFFTAFGQSLVGSGRVYSFVRRARNYYHHVFF